MRKLQRLCRRLLFTLALLLSASVCLYIWRAVAMSAPERVHWDPLPDGPQSSEDGCRLRSERARYAVDRIAADPVCRRDILRTACAFESGRLPYKRSGLSQSCPVRLYSGPANHTAVCHRLLLDCSYPKVVLAGTADCVGRCRTAGYRLAAISSSGSGGDCVCLQLLGGACTEPVAGGNCSSTAASTSASATYLVYNTELSPLTVLVSHAAPAYSAELQDLSWENDRVRVAYLLVLSGRGVRQVHRLLSALYYVNHYYYIHVDARDRYLYDSLKPLEARFSNVRLMRSRYPTIWGGTGLLDLMLTAFQDLLARSDWHWDYIINLSESDFPIRPDRELAAYLTEARHLSFLASHSGNYSEFLLKQAIGRYFVQCNNHMYFLGDREPIDDILFDGGSDWLTLNREFVQFVVSGLHSDLIGNIVRYFKYGLLPVESVFHTIAQNSQLCGSVANANLRLVNWDRKRGCRCQHLVIADWCGCSPMVFKEADSVVTAAHAAPTSTFFARKFDPTISVAAIDSVVERLLTPPNQLLARRARHGRLRYWQSAFHWQLDADRLTGHQQSVGRLLMLVLKAELGLTGSSPVGGPCLAGAAVDPVEVTEYYLEDEFQGPLLTARIQIGHGGDLANSSATRIDAQFSLHQGFVSVQVPNPVSPASNASLNLSVVASRYKEFEVGRQYDLKEGIFRDRLALLPPGAPSATGLQLRYAWGPGPAVTATFVLLDPEGAIRSAFQLTVPATSTASIQPQGAIGCVDLQAPGSLRPGVWRLLLLDEQQPVASVVAHCDFVLIPSLHNGTAWLEPGTPEFAAANHYASEVKPDPASAQYRALFQSVPQSVITSLRAANSGSGGSGAPAEGSEAWFARTLLGRRYSLEAMCRHSGDSSLSSGPAVCPGLASLTDPCSSADWSTGFPDSRYSLGSLDPLSGYLVQ